MRSVTDDPETQVHRDLDVAAMRRAAENLRTRGRHAAAERLEAASARLVRIRVQSRTPLWTPR